MFKNGLIIVDAQQRITGTSSNFTYSPAVIGINKVKRFRISKVSVPYSFYTIINQFIEITYNSNVFYVSILAGSYSAYQLATELQNNINVELGGGFTVLYHQAINKFQIIGPSNFQINFNTAATNYENYSVGVQMGFVLPTNMAEVLPASNDVYSKYAVDMSATTNIYLKSNALSMYYTSYFLTKKDSIVASIPVNVNPYNWIIYSEFTPTMFDFDDQQLNQIDFTFLDDSGNILDFRGLNPVVEIQIVFSD